MFRPAHLTFGAFNLGLKPGVLLGLTGLSVAAGGVTALNNGTQVVSQVGAALSPSFSKVKDFISTQSSSLQGGASQIFNSYRSWLDVFKGKGSALLDWLKSQEFSNIPTGLSILKEKLSSWYMTVKSKFEGSSMGESFKKYMNFEKLKSALLNASDMAEMLVTFIKKINEKSKLSEFFTAVWELGFHNLNVVKDIQADHLKRILEFTNRYEEFIQAVERLKKGEKWGKYKSMDELMNDLFPNTFLHMVGQFGAALGKAFLKSISECSGKDSCKEEDLIKDSLELFEHTIKSLFGIDNEKKN